MSISQPTKGTDGARSPWPIMGSESNRSMQAGFSVFSSACTAVKSTLAAASAWQSVNGWWSSTGAVFGWNGLRLAEDPHFASPFPPVPDSSAQSEEGSADSKARTILLVEDNPTDVFVIREVIEECGLNLRLRTATNGQDALRYLQDAAGDNCPALILLDLNLPKISGVEVLRQLRHRPPCNNTPVIVVTSSTAEADRAAVQRLGAEAYFQKPNNLQAYRQLAALIKRLLAPA